jgi:FtsZ-binding cell division protein ZapB
MEVKEAIKWFEWADDVYYCSMPNASPNNEFYKQSKEIKNLLKSLESENKKLKQYQDMWEWIQGVEMWNKEYEQVVKEVVQDIEVGYKSLKTIEQIGYDEIDKVSDISDSLIDGIYKKQNQRYIKKINRLGALKKENQAYREMWKSICGYINNFHKDSTTSGILDTRKVIGRIEQKYLGGGK